MAEEEVLVALPDAPSRIAVASRVRGSVLLSSLRSLRARNLFDSYVRALDPLHRDAVLSAVASVWYPIELAVAHYGACDRLHLSTELIEQIGAESGAFLNASVMAVLLRLTRELGATPWGALSHVDRLRERFWIGGAFTVVRTGPKDARVVWYGQPSAQWPYYRIAFGGFMAGIIRPLSVTLQVQPVHRMCDRTTLVYRVVWV